jgi:hypothetical protein
LDDFTKCRDTNFFGVFILVKDKIQPFEAAENFLITHFPHCDGALLAGSVVRGEATKTSDLDIIVFDAKQLYPFRESLFEFGWPIELFVHNLSSYKTFFESDCERARPSLPRMVSEGLVLKDFRMIESIKTEARELLRKGPAKWSDETIRLKRYFITDHLEDFIGSTNRQEELFITNSLAELVHEFILRTNGQWIGASKWIVRALKNFNEKVADEFICAFDEFYRTGGKDKVIQLIDKVLEPFGGRLFEGFSLGK